MDPGAVLHLEQLEKHFGTCPCAIGTVFQRVKRTPPRPDPTPWTSPPGKNLPQLFRRHDFELGVVAAGWGFVGAPAAELGGVAEAGALHVVVGDLDDELDA